MNKSPTLLITAWDGTLAGCGEVQCFCESLIDAQTMAGFDRLILLGPSCVDDQPLQRIVNHYRGRLDLSHTVIPYTFTEDRYWGKSIVGAYILSHDVASSDQVCYLDTDHVFFDSFDFPSMDQEAAWVSSECMDSIPLQPGTTVQQRRLLPKAHFNTSLVLGTKDALTPTFEQWADSYRLLCPFVVQRYLEEIAFAHAAQTTGTPVTRVSTTLQASWFSLPECASAFHYGGDSTNARHAKSIARQHYLLEQSVNATAQLRNAILHAAPSSDSP